MNTKTTVMTDFKAKAEEELRAVKENSQKWAVDDNVDQLRKYLEEGHLSLADIGTTEEELESHLLTGHRHGAQRRMRLNYEMTRELEEMLGRC